jgi:hypothetical protein
VHGDLLKILLAEIARQGKQWPVPIEFMKGCRHIDWKIYGIELSRDCRPARHK